MSLFHALSGATLNRYEDNTVSIPDRIFRAAEELASRWGVSRSELYARALDALLETHNDQVVTLRLNQIYDVEGKDSSLDPELAALQQLTLKGDR